jgi:hypothetical protein
MRFLRLLFILLLLSALSALAQQPMNLATVAGTAPSTAGKVDVKSADGDEFVRCNAAATCPVNANESGTWSVRIQDTSGNGLTTNSTTYSSKFALDVNVLGTLGTAFSTAGKVDVKSADGDVFVRSNAASTFPVSASISPQTSGGVSMSHLLAAASNNATAVKASAGQLYGACLYNNAGYPVYLKFYNKATAPAPATDTIVYEMPAQAGTERCFQTEEGVAFSTGLALALVKNISDTDNTSVAANDATVDLIYK